MWEAHEGMGWWMLFGGVFWVLFIVAITYLIANAVNGGTRNPPERPESPLDIAKRRLAAGEISHEEYERLRQTLSN